MMMEELLLKKLLMTMWCFKDCNVFADVTILLMLGAPIVVIILLSFFFKYSYQKPRRKSLAESCYNFSYVA